MTNRMTTSFLAAVAALLAGVLPLGAQEARADELPLAVPVKDVQFRIVDATFVSKLQGTSSRFESKDKYRGLVVTVEITKPKGMELTLAAQDLTLHYRYGSKSDVAKCYGLSTFSVQKDIDRPMNLKKSGLGRSATGLTTVKAEVVYLDMFFMGMEADTSQLYLFVAQPVGASFQTTGWQ